MKRKWKQKRLAAAAAMVIVVFSAIPAVPAMAAGSYETQVPSEIQLGAVDIMLTETETDESRKEIGATHGRLVTRERPWKILCGLQIGLMMCGPGSRLVTTRKAVS